MKLLKSVILPSLLGLSLFAGSAAADSHGHKGHDMSGIQVHKAWVRAVPPSSKMSAAYMMLHNNSTAEDHLVSAESNVAKVVELHNVRRKGEMMEMYQVKNIGIDANGKRELLPGSYHVMLIGLKQPLKVGDEVELTLNFMHAGAVKVKAPVKESGMMMKPGHGHMNH